MVRQIERRRIVLFLKSIQPSRPVDACGFQPIICMSTILYVYDNVVECSSALRPRAALWTISPRQAAFC